jgi:hypothetical protein
MPKTPRLRPRSRLSTRRDGDNVLDAASWFPNVPSPGVPLLDSLIGAIVVVFVVVGIVVLFTTVVFPLIALTLELVLLVVLFTAGAIGRLVFGRPWRIEAATIGRPRLTREAHAKGLRGSREAIEELAVAIQSGH